MRWHKGSRSTSSGPGSNSPGLESAVSPAFAASTACGDAVSYGDLDPRLARALSRLLLIGLCLAVALLLTGAFLAALRPEISVARTSSIIGLPRAIAAFEPGGFFGLGILVLLAVPAVRVLALLVAFARRRMWAFSGISVVVLVVLIVSGFLGLRAGG